MKKPVYFSILLIVTVILVSWGSLGHQTVGLIAEKYLDKKAKAAVNDYLGGESLFSVSTWADDVRGSAAYKHTASWHFLNLPIGLNRASFEREVNNLSGDNVYTALLSSEKILKDPGASRQEKAEALKFIVHLVGDLHQPMHVSRAEDKGGNTIQVNYEGKGTNLHSLWDSRLLAHQGLSGQELIAQCDKATLGQVRQWQKDPVMDWIWESYQVSSRLYSEVEAMKNRTIPDSYYEKYIPLINQRLDQAGIRLAGLLNAIFKTYAPGKVAPVTEKVAVAADTLGEIKAISLNEVGNYINQSVEVKGKVFGSKDFKTMTLVNLGGAYPNQLLTVVLKGDAKASITLIEGKTITVKGKIESYQGKPQLVVTDPKHLLLQ